MLDATRELLESGGYAAAGLNQILAAAEAPRGSLYFHFPGGKDQLVAEAIRRSGAEFEALFGALPGTAESATVVIDALGERMAESDWHKGCPIATVALEVAASNDLVRQACAAVYTSWERAIAQRLIAAGRPDASTVAARILTVLEGGLLLARVHRSRAPLSNARDIIRDMLD